MSKLCPLLLNMEEVQHWGLWSVNYFPSLSFTYQQKVKKLSSEQITPRALCTLIPDLLTQENLHRGSITDISRRSHLWLHYFYVALKKTELLYVAVASLVPNIGISSAPLELTACCFLENFGDYCPSDEHLFMVFGKMIGL